MNTDLCFLDLMTIACIATFNVSLEILSNLMVCNISPTSFFDITGIV